MLFCALLAVQRAFAIEAADGNRDAPAAVGPRPGRHLPRQGRRHRRRSSLVLEVLLGVGVVVLYGADARRRRRCSSLTCLAATAGLAAAGTLYGVLAAGLRVRETLLPLLLLPVVAPVLIGATRAFEAALERHAVRGLAWVGLLGVFALAVHRVRALAFGPLLEES